MVSLYRLSLLFVWCFITVPALQAAITPDSLWTLVYQRLTTDDTETVRQRLPGYIHQFYPNDPGLELEALQALRYRVEAELFDLPTAVLLTETAVDLALATDRSKYAADAYWDLSRYYYALNFNLLGAQALDKAMVLYAESGDRRDYDLARLSELMRIGESGKVIEAIDGLKALAAAADYPGNEKIRSKAYQRVMIHGMQLGDTLVIREGINYVDSVRLTTPNSDLALVEEGTTALGKATIAQMQGRYQAALDHYNRVAELSKLDPDHWRVANAYLAQANVTLEMGRPELAPAYLDKAQHIAEARKIDDLLVSAYQLREQLAVEENDYRAAYDYRNRQNQIERKLTERAGGFNLETYYLRKDKEQLETERTNQTLQLEMQQQRITSWRLLVLLGFALLAAAAFGLYYQRRARRKLAGQFAITERQAAELREQEAARTRFFTNVSHELRTPLTLVLDPVRQMTTATNLDTRQRRLLDMATQSGDQLEGLIDEILDFERLESGKLRVKPLETELERFFVALLTPFRSPAGRKQLRYHFQIDLPPGGRAAIDRTLYRRILINLTANAVKFTPEGGRVTVGVGLVDEALQLTVADSGPGISSAEQPRIFERFYQADAGRGAGSGSGVGLSMVRAYVDLLDGTLTLDSKVGEGSTFTVHLPIALRTAPAATTEHEAAIPKPVQEISGDHPSLLVVEDNPALQSYLRLLLQDRYEVRVADHGRHALDLLAGGYACDLVLTDLMMPVMDGYDLLAALKADDRYRSLPVVVLTARTAADDRLRALRIGVDDYLTKPFRQERLYAVLDALLENVIARAAPGEVVESVSVAETVSTADQAWLAEFETYVREHLHKDTFSVKGLGSVFAMSESTLLRTLRRLTGLTPSRYVQEVRLARARTLLETGRLSTVKEVSAAVGYGDGRSFSRAYRKRYGHLPSELLTTN